MKLLNPTRMPRAQHGGSLTKAVQIMYKIPKFLSKCNGYCYSELSFCTLNLFKGYTIIIDILIDHYLQMLRGLQNYHDVMTGCPQSGGKACGG